MELVKKKINRLSLSLLSDTIVKNNKKGNYHGNHIFVYPCNKATRVYPSTYFTKYKHGIVYNNLIAIIVMLQMTAIFPISATNKGIFRISKVLMSYSLLMFVILLSLIIYLIFNKVKVKKAEGRFEDVVIEYLFQIYLLPIFAFPIHWLESRNIAALFCKWYEFEQLYREVIGNKVALSRRKRYTIISVIILLLSGGIMVIMHLSMVEFEPIKVIPYCFFNITTYVFGGFWYLYLDAVESVARQLEKDFKRCLHNTGPSYIPAELKILWMTLNQLLQDFSSSLCYSLIFLLLFLFVTVILSVYGLLSQLPQGIKLKDIPHAVTACMAVAVIFFTCEAAENATVHMKQRFQRPLLLLNVAWMRKDIRKEIISFLRATVMNESEVNVKSYFVVNRGLFRALMSTMVTYLIVLLQFQIIVPGDFTKRSADNFTTDITDVTEEYTESIFS